MTLVKREEGGVSCVPTSQIVVQKSVDHGNEQEWRVETLVDVVLRLSDLKAFIPCTNV
jgi:hypothetical protein